mmetsp:Transcript_136262/g.435959  ORF Transcript_136262/g.435959 Transcript_136262/m.435959 type:complete len:243 (-) Transcript_136262:1500-2228(-)
MQDLHEGLLPILGLGPAGLQRLRVRPRERRLRAAGGPPGRGREVSAAAAARGHLAVPGPQHVERDRAAHHHLQGADRLPRVRRGCTAGPQQCHQRGAVDGAGGRGWAQRAADEVAALPGACGRDGGDGPAPRARRPAGRAHLEHLGQDARPREVRAARRVRPLLRLPRPFVRRRRRLGGPAVRGRGCCEAAWRSRFKRRWRRLRWPSTAASKTGARGVWAGGPGGAVLAAGLQCGASVWRGV